MLVISEGRIFHSGVMMLIFSYCFVSLHAWPNCSVLFSLPVHQMYAWSIVLSHLFSFLSLSFVFLTKLLIKLFVSREMVHLAIDCMWQVFKLQRSTPRNDFCRIAAKNGILLRLINTLYSLNEATRLASISVGGGFPVDTSTQRPRSGQLDYSHPILIQCEAPLSTADQHELPKVRHGMIDQHISSGMQDSSRASTSHSQRSDANQPDSRYLQIDPDRAQCSNTAMEVSAASKFLDPISLEKVAIVSNKEPSASTPKERDNLERWKIDPSRADVELRQQRVANATNRTSTDRPLKLTESTSNGFPTTVSSQQEQVRPLLSLLEKEPPSRHFSGQLEYVRHLSGLERHESVLPLLHASNEKKTNGELDFLMAEFAGN